MGPNVYSRLGYLRPRNSAGYRRTFQSRALPSRKHPTTPHPERRAGRWIGRPGWLAYVPAQLPVVDGRCGSSHVCTEGTHAACEYTDHNECLREGHEDSKRQAHTKVVEMVLQSKKSNEAAASERRIAAIGS